MATVTINLEQREADWVIAISVPGYLEPIEYRFADKDEADDAMTRAVAATLEIKSADMISRPFLPTRTEPRTFQTGAAFKSVAEARTALQEPPTVIELEEGQRQMVLLALAKLSIERPGWHYMINEVAQKMDNQVDGRSDTFERLRSIHAIPEKAS